jgi:hypothetical protein
MSSAVSSKTVDDVFAAFGGPAQFARTFALKGSSTASEMKRRRSISIDLWPDIVAAAGKRNIDWLTYETLTLMHAKFSRATRLPL